MLVAWNETEKVRATEVGYLETRVRQEKEKTESIQGQLSACQEEKSAIQETLADCEKTRDQVAAAWRTCAKPLESR